MAQSDAEPMGKPDAESMGKPETGSTRGQGSNIPVPNRGNPFNPEARPTDLIPDYPAGREHPAPEPANAIPGAPAPFAGSIDPTPMAPITVSAAVPKEPVPAGDPNPAPGLPAWTEAGDPATPGTGPHVPPPASQAGALPAAVQLNHEGEGVPDFGMPDAVTLRDLTADESLLRLLVKEEDLKKAWREIGQLEAVVTGHPRLSLTIGRELLDRLQSARNVLLNNIANYEEAQRQVSEVRLRLGRWQRLQFYEQPRFLTIYLVVWLLAAPLIAWVPMAAPNAVEAIELQAQALEPMSGLGVAALWWAISSGLIGGVVGAIFNLFRHASRNKDYDPDHALWYLLAPIVGMILAVGVFLIGRSGLFFGRQDSDFGIYATSFFLAFQQNLALRYFYRVFRRILPPDEATARIGER
jgi:hypothetical protein